MRNSIRFRLWSAAAVSIVIALGIAGVGLRYLFDKPPQPFARGARTGGWRYRHRNPLHAVRELVGHGAFAAACAFGTARDHGNVCFCFRVDQALALRPRKRQHARTREPTSGPIRKQTGPRWLSRVRSQPARDGVPASTSDGGLGDVHAKVIDELAP